MTSLFFNRSNTRKYLLSLGKGKLELGIIIELESLRIIVEFSSSTFALISSFLIFNNLEP